MTDFNFDGFDFDDFDFDFDADDFDFGNINQFNFNGAHFHPYILNNFSLHFNDVHVKENTRFVTDIDTFDTESTEHNGRLSYDIIGGADKEFFEIDKRTGKVFFKDAPDFENPLDHGRDNEYEVKVRVTDAGGNTDTQTLYVQVKNVKNEVPPNQAPEIISNRGGDTANVGLDENTTFVTNVNTSDDFSSEANGELSYSITSGSDRDLFTINERTGVLSFINAPDFENPGDVGGNNVYNLHVTVADAGGLTDTQSLNVRVNDVDEAPVNQAPEIISNGGGDTANVDIDENITFVTNVNASDDFSTEANGELSYAITSGDDQGLFTINENTGVLSFNNAPDFENPGDANGDNTYNLHVTVTDAGGLTDTQTININVNDVDEAPVNKAPRITSNGGGDEATVGVNENITFVTNVNASDDFSSEANGELSYAITSGDDQGLFTIDEGTGRLSFNNAPDFENPVDANGDNTYSLHVTVTDAGGLTDTQTININVNDVNEAPVNKAPEITSNGGTDFARVRIQENSTFVTNVEATDDFSSEANGELVYSISGGPDRRFFSLDPDTGELTFNEAPDFETPLDAGANNGYRVNVTVTDAGGLSDTQRLAVFIDDVNEAPDNKAPKIISNGGGDTASLNLNENVAFVTNVNTSDDFSTEANGELTYAITRGADQNAFSIDESTGELTFNNAPDFENPSDENGDNRFHVGVTVTDAGGLTDTQVISIAVNDVDEVPDNNNEAPKIISDGGRDGATLSINENTAFVTNVNTSDDSGTEANGGLTYSITGGADQTVFSVNESTGILSFNNAPDFENPGDENGDNKYHVRVTVTDAGGLTDTQAISVSVNDVDDSPAGGGSIVGTPGNDSIKGTEGDDTIEGLAGNDHIQARGGNDVVFGGAGDDVIGGGLGNDRLNGTDATARGVGEKDRLVGGAGMDSFILGDSNGAFYLGNGFSDLAVIQDFNAGEDSLVLFGSASDYALMKTGIGTGITRTVGGERDAIANIKGASVETLNLHDFEYVG